ncbi:transcriptional regulator TACO1-like protein [Piptocephalis cylindrospora]|uniref:Transcriptional regulator TACO1-like protein n=1 Tax=Piptocephalis cylindrospora TaxID=1907219 RepID=A0A4P9Y7V1_9FUNG|nr:transcriptional regulator TACO1-like protein [Piptocephalis cylindrospora]|eukprot:RKP14361.1 transcriptional regulator TACO1-like protein [Piptocephalis cylindrospora]
MLRWTRHIPTSPLSSCALYSRRWAGHNKWSKIKRGKFAADQQRSVLFSKMSLRIISSIRQGGADPGVNPRYAAALAEATRMDFPKSSLETAIRKATNPESGQDSKDVVYEATGFKGIALVIEAVTDNPNRTIKAIRHALKEGDGVMASVGWMFERKGCIQFTSGSTGKDVESMMEAAIDLGAEDVDVVEDGDESSGPPIIEIQCPFQDMHPLALTLTKEGFEVCGMNGTYLPTSESPELTPEELERAETWIERLESLDDVVRIHSSLPS